LAGPWPQPQGHGFVISSLSYLEADSRLPNANPVVGDGDFSRLGVGVYVEYGVSEHITIGGSAQLAEVRLRGLSESESSSGVGDVELFVRPVVWRSGASILAAQATLAIPGGYEAERNPALGDGAVGAELRLLYGRGFELSGLSSFFDLQGAYRFRLGAPADQVRVDATLGTHPAEGWMLLLQSRDTISAGNQTDHGLGPGLAGRYGTDYDLYSLAFSVVGDVSPHWSVELGVADELGGRNYSTGEGVFVSIWRKF
jgi:hypothetical protein